MFSLCSLPVSPVLFRGNCPTEQAQLDRAMTALRGVYAQAGDEVARNRCVTASFLGKAVSEGGSFRRSLFAEATALLVRVTEHLSIEYNGLHRGDAGWMLVHPRHEHPWEVSRMLIAFRPTYRY